MSLIRAQRLDHVVHIHKLDLTAGLDKFFDEHQYMQFRLVYLDAGLYDVVKSCIKSGGVLIFDQFNHELAPG